MIPEDLIRYFPDSEITMSGWRPESRELTLSIEKEVGPESGALTFTGVTYMAIATAFTASSVRISGPDEARRILPLEEMAADGVVFVVEDVEGVNNVIVAESLSYRRDA
ncbi:MAG TPA: hypothetical protein VGX48_21050 [Pyrinomonadaceae bacterium]|nr:hypothetical protein [Pyrinomonadaceae bacterium]